MNIFGKKLNSTTPRIDMPSPSDTIRLSMSYPPKFICALLLAIAPFGAQAQTSVATDPVGFIKFSPAASVNGTTRKFTVGSFPLQAAAKWTGIASAEPGISTLSGTNAAWPSYGVNVDGFVTHVVRFKSGVSVGRIFPIGSNTATTLTLQLPPAVTNLGTSVDVNDSFEIVPVNTLSSLFGSTAATVKFDKNPVQGSADLVYLWNGSSFIAYWFDGSQWINQGDEFSDSGATPVFSDESAWVARRSTGLIEYSMLGSVPVPPFLALEVPGSTSSARKFTFLCNPFPASVTLDSFNLKTLSGWQSNAVSGSADIVYIWNGAAWIAYWYDGSQWINQGDEFSDSGSTPIPAGSGVWVARRSSGTGETTFTKLTRPYSLL